MAKVIKNSYICVLIQMFMKGFFKMLLASFVGTSFALIIAVFLFMGIIGSMVALSSSSVVAEVKPNSLIKINLSSIVSDYQEQDPMGSLSSMDFQSLNNKPMQLIDAVKAINEAALDPAVKLIYINAAETVIPLSNLEELRCALQNFREISGKPVVAYMNNLYTLSSYYIASVADKVYMNSDGTVMVSGVGANLFFLKDCLDWAGVDVQLIRHGKYKSAGEMFVANKISEANREQYESYFNSMWGVIASAVASSREVEIDRLDNLVHNLGLKNALSMLENKLVDDTLSLSGMEERLTTLMGVEKFKEVNMISLEEYASVTVKENLKAKERVALVYADGEIVLNGKGLSADKLVPIINDLRDDERVKAVVLRVNSPGGDAYAAELIRRALMELKSAKPLVVSMGEYAASGGYWISAQADKIYADCSTLTGSIGVFSIIPNLAPLAKRVGVNGTVVGTGSHVGMANLMRPLDKAEVDYMTEMVEDVYGKFVKIVANGRNMSVEAVDSIAQGRIWSGLNAQEIGLVDELGTLEDAIVYAADLAQIEGDYRLVRFPKQPTAMEALMEMFGAASSAAASVAALADNPQEAVQKIFGEALKNGKSTVYARVPFICNMIY